MQIALEGEVFEWVQEAAQKMSIDTYVVGGFVRDKLLGRESKDLDFVCVGKGIDLAKALKKMLGEEAHLSVFKNFGTAQIRYKNWDLEFIGARKESYQRNSRKPFVEEGSLQDDQNRRDFTINAMAIKLDGANEIIDPFGGVKDLKERRIQTPLDPEKTFDDDPLRMMRAVRFASQLQFSIDPETLLSIKKMSARLHIISMERIVDELNKIILSKKPSDGFKLLFDTGLLHQFFPEIVALQGVETKNGKSHKDNFYHTLEVLDNVSKLSNDLWLRWAAILHDIAKPPTKKFDNKEGWTFHGHEDLGARMVKKIFKRLRLPLNDSMRKVEKLVRLHLRPIALVKDIVTDSAIRRLIFDAGQDLEDLMILCKSDITTKNMYKQKKFQNNLALVEQKIIDVEERDQVRNFQPPIDGFEIMKIFKLKEGKEVGILKSSLREAILEGTIRNDYQEAYNFVVAKGIVMGLTPKEKYDSI